MHTIYQDFARYYADDLGIGMITFLAEKEADFRLALEVKEEKGNHTRNGRSSIESYVSRIL